MLSAALLLASASAPAGPVGGAGPAAVPSVQFTAASRSAGEASGTIVATLQLSETSATAVSVPFTVSGSATSGVDFTIDPSPAVIPAGLLTKNVSITLAGDALDEADETLVITLGTPTGATLGATAVHTVTILDDDAPPVIGFALLRQRVGEADGSFTIDLGLSQVSGRAIRVHYSKAGTALDPGDYSLPPSPLVIPAGSATASLAGTLFDDAGREGAETAIVSITGLEGATLGTFGTHGVVILDDDPVTWNPVVSGLELDRTQLDFALTRVGESGRTETIVVTNDDSLPITFQSVVTLGADAADFTITYSTPPPFVLNPGQSTSFDVGYTPLEKGLREAQLAVRQRPAGVDVSRASLSGLAFGPSGAELLLSMDLSDYTSTLGEVWVADYGVAGDTHLVVGGGEIFGTVEDPLYRVARAGEQFGYSFELPDGTYDVTVRLAEIEGRAPGQRIFDVDVEGVTVLDDFDISAVVGQSRAYWVTREITITDGSLDVELDASVGEALVAALEVRSVPIVDADETLVNFGTVAAGEFAELPLTLTNSGLHAGRMTQLSFNHTSGEGGHVAGHDFYVEIGETRYYGDHVSVTHDVDVTIPAGDSLVLIVGYEPTEHAENVFTLAFQGDFDSVDVAVQGIGSTGDWGYLHPIADPTPELVVDYNRNGSETVLWDASESHTHEPGHSLIAYQWEVGGSPVGSDITYTGSFPLGDSAVELTITDDNFDSASVVEHLVVHSPFSVPDVLAHYYDATGAGASALLDALPSRADFMERRADMRVATGAFVGGSPYAQDVLVRLVGEFFVTTTKTFQFIPQGGAGSRVYLNGVSVSGPQSLGAGRYTLDVRFAVNVVSDLPLSLRVLVGGIEDPSFDQNLTHNEHGLKPLIHAMPTVGAEGGGNLITIQGFGFYPSETVIVHWGTASGPDLREADFVAFTTERIEFYSPPSPGPPGVETTINVRIETSGGNSNTRPFTYSPDGDVPIRFLRAPDVLTGAVTTGNWGPDGRFYVGLITGEIKAITFDQDYNATAVQTYAGVSGLSNNDVLGLCFNPFDADSPVKIYVAHAELWQNGGGSFTGPSFYTGQVSVLTGPSFNAPVTLIDKLPSSNHDHGVNGSFFDHNGDFYVAAGGNTNAGVKYPAMGDLPESPLSGAILKFRTSRPDFNGLLSYVHSVSGLPDNDQVHGEQVDLAPGTHVEVYAPGTRNTYDMVLTTWNLIYATDNGPNFGFGPASTGPGTEGPDPTSTNDEVMVIERGNYYGHANRSRGRHDYRQSVYRHLSGVPSMPGEFTQAMHLIPSSTNGIVEYRATAFNGQMRGDLLAQKFGGKVYDLELGPDKRTVVGSVQLNPFTGALDVQVGPGGAILAVDYSGAKVQILVPDDDAAVGLTVYDIFPWRAPSTGGRRFVIGGEGFGTLANTTVTIGGRPAVLTSVSAKRIVGTLPSGLPELELVDVRVDVGLDSDTAADAFMALPATPGRALGFWEGGPAMPEALGEVAGGVIDGVLYLMGEGVADDTETLAYDLIGRFWSDTPAERPFAGHHQGAEVLGGKLYLVGGLDDGPGKLQIFDPHAGPTGTWTLGRDMPWAGGSSATAVIGGKIYACGGIVGSGTVANLASYDPATDFWRPLPPMPTGVNHAASATDGQKLYVFGGRGGGNWPQPGWDVVQVFDPLTATWDSSDLPGSTLAPMPSGRGGTGKAVYYQGEFYVFGGETSDAGDPEADPGRVFAQVFAYDPVANTWRQDKRMPTARHGIFPLLFQNRIHVIGGGVVFGNSQSTVHEVFQRL